MNMFNTLFLCLVLLFLKHWYVDFVVQTPGELANKGSYLHWQGIKHAVKHGIGTLMVLAYHLGMGDVLLLASLDMMIHYHIDWAKLQLQDRLGLTPQDAGYWNLFGLDQLAHAFTYLFLLWLVL